MSSHNRRAETACLAIMSSYQALTVISRLSCILMLLHWGVLLHRSLTESMSISFKEATCKVTVSLPRGGLHDVSKLTKALALHKDIFLHNPVD